MVYLDRDELVQRQGEGYRFNDSKPHKVVAGGSFEVIVPMIIRHRCKYFQIRLQINEAV